MVVKGIRNQTLPSALGVTRILYTSAGSLVLTVQYMPKQALPRRLNATSSEIQSVERALRFPTSTKSVAYGRFTNTTGVRITLNVFLITLQFFLSKTGSIALQTGNLVTLNERE